jgi:hypothetical protein
MFLDRLEILAEVIVVGLSLVIHIQGIQFEIAYIEI